MFSSEKFTKSMLRVHNKTTPPMSANDVCGPEVGPLERHHMKGMVQRNSMETVALTKLAKHLETERKAFVRQSTRDEDEMKQLLQRLHVKQQTARLDEWTDSDDDTIVGNECDSDDTIVINPYPITIVPKYGANGTNTKLTGSQTRIGHQGKPARRRSGDYDDVHDSMSILTTSSASISDHHSNMDDVTTESLASPNAISSVRRLRKTVPEQMQRKIMIRTNSDMSWGPDIPASPSPSRSHSRSNSLKERKRSTCSTIDEAGSERASSRTGRRGTSLKERKSSHVTDDGDHARLPRSYSMVTKMSLSDVTSRHGNEVALQLKRYQKQGTDESGSDVKLNILSDAFRHGEQTRPIIRKNSKKTEKMPLERKTSK